MKWGADQEELEQVELPESLRIIGMYAFKGATKLLNIKLLTVYFKTIYY